MMPNESRPTKPDQDVLANPPAGKGPRKGPQGTQRRAIKGKMIVKPAATKTAAGRGETRHEGDQQQPTRRPRSTGSYVRLRVRMDDGVLSIVDSHLVDSELARPAALHGTYAYEVVDGDRLLHADSLPDIGMVRSFADPDGTGEQRGHHSYEQSTYEFDVRVPTEHLTRAALSNISVVLHRIKDRPERALRDAPLGTQYERELREVASVVGIPASVLPPGVITSAGTTSRTVR